MSITYSFEIISVNEQARCMEIVYTAEGHQTMHIGARLPYEGETLEQVIRLYEPVRYWEEQQTPVIAPQVGTIGTLESLSGFESSQSAQNQPTVEGAQTL